MSFADEYGYRTGGSKGNPTATVNMNGKKNKRVVQNQVHTIDQDDDDGMNYIFQNPDSNMSRYTVKLEQLIQKISTNTSSLQKLHSKIGTRKDTKKSRDQTVKYIKENNEYTKESVALLKHCERCAKEEKGEAELKYKKLNHQASEAITKATKMATLVTKQLRNTILKEENQQHQHHPTNNTSENSTSSTNSEQFNEKSSLLGQKQQQQQQQHNVVRDELEFNHVIISERYEDIKEIESSLLDASDVMKELRVMVEEQGETLDLIVDNIEETEQQVKKGNVELKKAQTYQKKGGNTMCILLSVILCVALAAILIISIIFAITTYNFI